MRIVRLTLISVFLLFLAFAGAGWYVANKYSAVIQQKVLDEFNANLNAEVSIESIEFSSFKKIPFLSLSFRNVLVRESMGYTESPDTLLFAKELSFQFNLWDVYNGNYALKHLDIESAKCYVNISASGKSNYEIWKPTKDTSSSNFSFSMEAINFKDVFFVYKDRQSNVFVKSNIQDIQVSGNFTSEQLALKFSGKLQEATVLAGGVYALKNRSVQLNSGIRFQNASSTFELEKGTILFDNALQFDLGGFVASNSYKFSAVANASELETVLSLLPEAWSKYWSSYRPRGLVNVNVQIASSNKRSPKIDLGFELSDGSLLTPGKTPVELSALDLKGNYTNGELRNAKSSAVNLTSVSGKFPSGSFSGKVQLSNFSDLNIKGKIEGDLELGELMQFLKVEGIKRSSGKALFKLDGDIYWDQIQKKGVKQSRSTLDGSVEFSAVNLQLVSNISNLSDYKGKVRFDKQVVEFQKSEGQLNSTRFQLNGRADNFFEWILKVDKLLRITATVSADKLLLEEFLSAEATNDSASTRSLAIPGIELQLKADIKDLSFGKFQAKNVETNLFIGQRALKANPIKLDLMDGAARGKMAIIKRQKNGFGLSVLGNFKHVNVKELFRQLNNFGQDEIVSENLEGIADLDLELSGGLDDYFDIEPSTVSCDAHLSIVDGRLVNYTTLQSISDYFKTNLILKKVFRADDLSESLKDVQFKKLENDLFIRNSALIIPKVQLHSNVLNLNIAGQHGFNDSVNYKVDFDISDLLVKNRNFSTENGEVVDDGTGRYRVFMLLSGTTDELDIQLDKSAKKDFKKKQRAEEGNELKNALNEEFGWFSKDTSVHQQEKAMDFEIEWEEEEGSGVSKEEEPKKDQTTKRKKRRGWLTPNEEEKEFFEFKDDDF